MKAADVRRVIEHAIPTEVGLTCDYAQTGDKYEVHCIKTETSGDAEFDETLLSHALAANTLHHIMGARKSLAGQTAPRLFWHTPPVFIPATPQTEAAIRARYIITNLPKRFETADEVTAAIEVDQFNLERAS